jgi:hypothetical protein
LRDNWFKQLANWDASQLVFLDESGINSKLGQRSYGYAPKGQRARSKVTTTRAPNLSLLPALTVDGYIVCNVYEGAVNQDVFAEFIEHDLLPLCNPYPGPRSVIILDNARVHKAVVCSQFPIVELKY